MLRWLGHDAVAVLDGAWQAWQVKGLPISSELPTPTKRSFTPRPRAQWLIDAAGVLALLSQAETILVDARAEKRYRGEVEPIDTVAGHIPGAVCAPSDENLDADGHFKAPQQLRERFQSLLEGRPAEQAVFYCGSGVSAAHNLLALAYAGLEAARLYPGSWSEWITDPSRPIAKG
jgi:thiosulfate/3-mercaptopyruvate sulfurtransferase